MTWDPQSGQWVGTPGQPPQPNPPAAPPPAGPPAPQGGYAAPQGQYPAPGQYPQYAAPAAPRPNPFVGVPISDFVRDGIAVVLLVMSLTFPWDARHDATDRIEVVLITIVSILSVAITYLARAGVFGPTFGIARGGLVRLLANAPYFLMATLFFLGDVVVGGGDGLYMGDGGVGAGLAIGLAGAILAAQPRQGEIAQGGNRPLDQLWRWVAIGLAALAAVTVLLGIVIFLVNIDRTGFSGAAVTAAIVTALLGIPLIGIPAFGLLQGREEWRLITVLVGGSVIGLYLLGKGDSVAAPLRETLHYLPSGLVFWVAVAAVAAAVPVRTAMKREANLWDVAAKQLLVLAFVGGGIQVLVQLLRAVAADDKGRPVVLVVLTLLYAAAAVVGWLLVTPTSSSRSLAFIVMGVLLLLGIISMIVTKSADFATLDAADLFLGLVIPLGGASFLGVAAAQDARVPGANPAAAPYGAPGYPQAPAPGYPQAPAPGYQQAPTAYAAPPAPPAPPVPPAPAAYATPPTPPAPPAPPAPAAYAPPPPPPAPPAPEPVAVVEPEPVVAPEPVAEPVVEPASESGWDAEPVVEPAPEKRPEA